MFYYWSKYQVGNWKLGVKTTFKKPGYEENNYKRSIHQGDKTIVNIYAPNIGTPNYIKQIITDLKKGKDSNTIIVGYINTPLFTMNRSSRKKISKEAFYLNYTLDQMNIYRTFHPTSAEYTFFSSVHRTFFRLITC